MIAMAPQAAMAQETEAAAETVAEEVTTTPGGYTPMAPTEGKGMAVDALLSPPFWLQVVIWTPLTIGTVLGALRLFKVIPLLAHYQRRYGEQED